MSDKKDTGSTEDLKISSSSTISGTSISSDSVFPSRITINNVGTQIADTDYVDEAVDKLRTEMYAKIGKFMADNSFNKQEIVDAVIDKMIEQGYIIKKEK